MSRSKFRLGLLGCVLAMVCLAGPALALPWGYSVKEYGAVGDGKTKDTQAIQAAIDAAHNAGGGTVYFPPGTYLSGTLMLRSFITLHLEPGSTLLGSTDLADFRSTPPKFRSYTENYVHQSLLFGEDLEHITLEGRGTIDGQGTSFVGRPFRELPYLVRLVGCRNVRVRDLTLVNSPMWVQHYMACDDLVISGIRVNSYEGTCNDGIDIDSCRNVRISDCYIHSGDDALVLKSTSNRTCENVTVTNCVLSTSSRAFKLGTESNGGFRNITVSNCAIRKPGLDEYDWDRTLRGKAAIELMVTDGGFMERINISNLTVRGVSSVLVVRLRNRARPYLPDGPKPGIGRVRDIRISNIVARDVATWGSEISGLPGHPVENVSLSDIDIVVEGGAAAFPPGQEIPEALGRDPVTNKYGIEPAYGFFCQHVKRLRLRNVNFGWEKPDQRPALICEDVEDLELDRFVGPSLSDASPLIVQRDVRRAFIRGCPVPKDTGVFLRLEGKNEHITVVGNDLSLANTAFEFAEGTSEEALYTSDNRVE